MAGRQIPKKGAQVNLEIGLDNDIETDEVIEIYKANNWSSAEKQELLIPALKNSNSLVTARISGKLVGIGNAWSEYYNKNLLASVKLEKINGIGDEGLVNVSEGTLGVVVIRKGKLVLQSAVTFLDIKPGSKKQAILWDIYRRIVQQL